MCSSRRCRSVSSAKADWPSAIAVATVPSGRLVIWAAVPGRVRGSAPSCARLGSPDLLHEPAIAVRVAEGEERVVVAALRIRPRHLTARPEMEDLADVGPARGELGTRAGPTSA